MRCWIWLLFLQLSRITFFTIGTSDMLQIGDIEFEDWRKAKEFSCSNFNVTFWKNFTLQNHDYMQVIVTNGKDKFTSISDTYNCSESNATHGICIIDESVLGDSNTILNFTLNSGNAKKLLLSEVINTRDIDRAGSLQVSTKGITSGIVSLTWILPWKTYCSRLIAYISYNFQICIIEDGSLKKCKSSSEIKSKRECRSQNFIFECFKNIEDLEPDVNYVFRIRYSLDLYDTIEWSRWSNNLNFTTKSIVPVRSPSLQCSQRPDFIHLSWKKLDEYNRIASLYYQLSYGNNLIKILSKSDRDGTYNLDVKIEEFRRISIQACSNSGCAPQSNSCILDFPAVMIMEYKWLFLLLIPIGLIIVIIIFRRKIKSMIHAMFINDQHLVYPRWFQPRRESSDEIIRPRSPVIIREVNQRIFTSDGIYFTELTSRI